MSFFETLINEIQAPKIYISSGKECYICGIRNQLIQITPEETVRQKIIKYLISHKAVPEDMLKVEMRLSKYKIDSALRADIIIHKRSGNKMNYSPWL